MKSNQEFQKKLLEGQDKLMQAFGKMSERLDVLEKTTSAAKPTIPVNSAKKLTKKEKDRQFNEQARRRLIKALPGIEKYLNSD